MLIRYTFGYASGVKGYGEHGGAQRFFICSEEAQPDSSLYFVSFRMTDEEFTLYSLKQ